MPEAGSVVEHEESLIRAFVRPHRKTRLLELLKSAKGREKLRKGLAHFHDLDPRFAHLVPPSKHRARDIETSLRAKGAPENCHILSESAELDGREMPLGSALAEVVGGGMGTFVSCIPGRLGYFESEEAGERYILERAVQHAH
jgi:hypothetical protein